MAGYEPGEFPSTFENWKEKVHPNDLERATSDLNKYISNPCDATAYNVEFRFLQKNGQYIWLRTKGKVVTQDSEGKPIRFVGTHSDISALKRAEFRLKNQIYEMKSINKKLEAYSYTISHDLKEPIRSIRTFAEFIKEDYADTFNDEAKDYFDRIIRASTRMAKMIEDLLILSRVGRVDVEFKRVSTAELVDDVKDILRQKIKENNCSVIAKELPEIVCQPVWLKTVFQNLISNSIKYCDKEKTEIEITHCDFPKHHEFSFKDNGQGIEENQFDKIFGLFRKAHQDRNIEGSGAGLAIVASVIDEHHGKTWVDWSRPGEGTIIKVTIRKTDEERHV
jgi:light-regulated signal transduction histidine kinase (bacteriophytochrome)